MSTVRPAPSQQPSAPATTAPASSASGTGSFGLGDGASGPQLSDLGKRIEMLRVDRGVSKQLLARAAGTSRQQLWRVMTGKSELTSTLCQRLASVLDVDSRTLSSAALAGERHPHSVVRLSAPRLAADVVSRRSLPDYLETSTPLIATLRTLPVGDDGVALKCAVINCLEERARAARLQIPAWLFRVRASVLDGSL